MKKKTGICVLVFLVIFPALALAGMVMVDDEMELGDVTGQVGMTVDMTLSMTLTSLAWGDADGFGTYTTAGWLIMSSVSMPQIQMNNVQIDLGKAGSTSYLSIATSGNLITGNLTIGSLVVGSSATSSTESLGEIRVTGMAVSFGTIRISGHD